MRWCQGSLWTSPNDTSVASGQHCMAHLIQASHFPRAITPSGGILQVTNSMDMLWPPASAKVSRDHQGGRKGFAGLGTSQELAAPGWGRAAAATRAVGAQEAVPAPRLPSGSSGRLMPCFPCSEMISPIRAGCSSHQGVPAPAVRARGEGGRLLLQTRLTKCWYYA